MSLVDLHTHILANIDDGAVSKDVSIEMLESMISSGVECVVATPHFDLSSDDPEYFLRARAYALESLRSSVNSMQLQIKVLSGSEIMFSPNLPDLALESFTIENTDYLLIELSTRYDDPSLRHTMEAILASGFIPIIAHVERYSYLVNDSQRIVDLIEIGVLFQLNISSLTNENNGLSKALIKHNLIHIIGSDCHDMKLRKPSLEKNLVDESIYRIMNSILKNEVVEIKKPSKMMRLFKRFF